MKGLAQVRPSFIGLFTCQVCWALLCAGARPCLWLSASMTFPFSELLWGACGAPLGFHHWQVLPSGGGKSRGSPAGWDLDGPPARSGLRVTSVGSLGNKPLCLNVSPWMKQHRWCMTATAGTAWGRGGWGGSVCGRYKFFTTLHLILLMAIWWMWHYHPHFKDGETCFHRHYVMFPRLHSS